MNKHQSAETVPSSEEPARPPAPATTKARPRATLAATNSVADQLPCVAFRVRAAGTDRPPVFSYISAQAREMLGLEPNAIMLDARVLFERIPEEDATALQAGIAHAFATLGQWQHELRLRFRDTVRWFECRGRVHQPGADTLCADGYLADITERKAADDRMRLWTSVLQQSAEGIVICDPQQRILAVNPAFERLTGFSQQEAVGNTPRILHSGRQDKSFYVDMWRTIEATGRWSGEIWNRRKNGELYVEWLALNAVYDPHGRVTHYAAIFSDITAHKAAEDRLQYLAQYDALTDLPNRSLLLRRLEQLIELAERSKLRIAVLFMDLDRFKEVNDSMGHEVGDLLLQTVAQRIRSTVRRSDTVARLGGDEFVMLLSGLHLPEDAAQVARQVLASVCKPLRLKDRQIRVSASIGICVFPDEGVQAGDLIRNADTAMYRAKTGGRNRYELYARQMSEQAAEPPPADNAL